MAGAISGSQGLLVNAMSIFDFLGIPATFRLQRYRLLTLYTQLERAIKNNLGR
jgi:hypothetical protein